MSCFFSDNRHFGDLNLQWPYEADGEAYFRRTIAGEESVCFVAEIDGEVQGYVAGALSKPYSPVKGKWAELENMFVRSEVRSQGIGGKLVQAFYDWCRSHAVDHVQIEAFAPNTRAIAFYEKQGFASYATKLTHDL